MPPNTKHETQGGPKHPSRPTKLRIFKNLRMRVGPKSFGDLIFFCYLKTVFRLQTKQCRIIWEETYVSQMKPFKIIQQLIQGQIFLVQFCRF